MTMIEDAFPVKAIEIPLLDHGYVKFIESWGSDERIIEAARMSTNKGFVEWNPYWKCKFCGCLWRDNEDNTISLMNVQQKSCNECEHKPISEVGDSVPGDKRLLSYLYKHKHLTPFEMAGMTIEVQAPLMVFREWHRHRTQSYNELSARYTPLPDVNYIPTLDRCLVVPGTNKQAGKLGDAPELTHSHALEWLQELHEVYDHAEAVYQSGLKRGMPKELARLCVPVGRYSRMRASANLRNWLAFLTLRMDTAAQWEIRQYAKAVGTFIEDRFPRTWKLFIS